MKTQIYTFDTADSTGIVICHGLYYKGTYIRNNKRCYTKAYVTVEEVVTALMQLSEKFRKKIVNEPK